MGRLLKKLSLFFLILIVLDRISGTILEKYFYKQTHGDDFVSIQLLDSTKADIIILGSSRASHHYLTDSIIAFTGLQTYNGGRDNMGIHYYYACLQEIFKRYKPKQVIIDIIPNNFIKGNQDVKQYFDVQASVLFPFASKHPFVFKVLDEIAPQDIWKTKLIKTYAYNSLLGSIFQNAFTEIGHKQIGGYEPLLGTIDSSLHLKQQFYAPDFKKGMDTNAFNVLKKCLELCDRNGVKPTLCFSPFYFPYQTDKLLISEFQSLTRQYHTQLIDLCNDTSFNNHPQYFYDEYHLNNEGAIKFSRKLMQLNAFVIR
jgi:hypothetical protein